MMALRPSWKIAVGVLLAVAIAAAGFFVHAERAPVAARAELSRTTTLIGDTITYSLEVRVRIGIEVELPDLEKEFADFSIRDRQRTVVTDGARTVYRYRYDVARTEPGEVVVAPLTIRYRSAGESSWREKTVRGFTLTVKGLLGAPRAAKAKVTIGGGGMAGGRARASDDDGPGRTMEVETTFGYDIRDGGGPKKVVTLRDRLFMALFAVGGVILFVVLLSFLYEKLFRRKTPPPLPDEVALERARGLDPQAAFEKGEAKEFYARLDAILKTYLRARFGLEPLEKTTREFLAELAVVEGVDPAIPEEVREVLLTCDLAKYSSYGSSEAELAVKRDAAIAIVQKTTPAAQPVSQGTA